MCSAIVAVEGASGGRIFKAQESVRSSERGYKLSEVVSVVDTVSST